MDDNSNRLWAPWRMEYILASRTAGCFLCDIIQDDDDRENLVLKRGATCFVVMNRYPYNNGHLMVAPYRHVDGLETMTREERTEMMETATEMLGVLRTVMNPHGFNTGLNTGAAAGAGLKEHSHLHIVPRWSGDTNFMPVIGQTKVIPQSLHDLWDQLKEALSLLPPGAGAQE
ncbi:MAG: HIT domain-containing protein [Spartobacteria bacterium]|nr:HIT domain-containing protein [Spartobacteria bacterium]